MGIIFNDRLIVKRKSWTLIHAEFRGQDGSLGYKLGKKYLLLVNDMTIKRSDDDSGYCVYESLQAFLDNWNNITRYGGK